MNREEYHQYLRSEAWQEKRRDAIRRAGGRCSDCLATGKLHIHHLTYDRVGNELPGDLIACCPWCHHVRHKGTPKCQRCGGPVFSGLDFVPEYCFDCFFYLEARRG